MAEGRAVPLSEQLLARLPGPRRLWVAAWLLVPWLNLLVVWATEANGQGVPGAEVLNRTAVTFSVAVALWGATRVADDLHRLRPELTRAVEQDEPDVQRLFPRLDSVMVPVVLTVVVAIALPVDELLGGDSAAAAVQLVTWLVIGIPLSTAAWVYLAVQVGLVRLGRGHLRLRGYDGDRSLGLRPVGRLAFTGFWMIFGSVAPLVVTGFSDVPGAIVGTGLLVVAVGMFFLSLRDLHQRMVAVKEQELRRATTLYQVAYDKVRHEPTLEVLQREVGLLNAAEAMEKRAERILAWPFDEVTLTRVITIVSSAVAAILARILLAPTGL